ncbi:DNA-binding protein Ewg [Portunus trituberculatus]|uniref:DNA-binding protein Ewg n=1 Tax=Portunus trituberculatus TaxID=210409 RepID=A0A5B7GQ13_PORTR|nr:DNA-binding protein Ewg [Portunus trituberculatus]
MSPSHLLPSKDHHPDTPIISFRSPYLLLTFPSPSRPSLTAACLRVPLQNELEVFVPFMVRCSVGEERPVPWSHFPRPPWWPKKRPFRMPPTRSALIGLVERCYSFHGCEYLLQFCASLVAQMPSAGYRFNDNRDGTTSMYHGSTGKLLVTFRNENRVSVTCVVRGTRNEKWCVVVCCVV